MESQTIATVHSFKKKKNEEVKVTVREYKKKKYVDLRLHFLPEGQEESRPTKKGITLGVEFIPELISGLQKAEEEVTART